MSSQNVSLWNRSLNQAIDILNQKRTNETKINTIKLPDWFFTHNANAKLAGINNIILSEKQKQNAQKLLATVQRMLQSGDVDASIMNIIIQNLEKGRCLLLNEGELESLLNKKETTAEQLASFLACANAMARVANRDPIPHNAEYDLLPAVPGAGAAGDLRVYNNNNDDNAFALFTHKAIKKAYKTINELLEKGEEKNANKLLQAVNKVFMLPTATLKKHMIGDNAIGFGDNKYNNNNWNVNLFFNWNVNSIDLSFIHTLLNSLPNNDLRINLVIINILETFSHAIAVNGDKAINDRIFQNLGRGIVNITPERAKLLEKVEEILKSGNQDIIDKINALGDDLNSDSQNRRDNAWNKMQAIVTASKMRKITNDDTMLNVGNQISNSIASSTHIKNAFNAAADAFRVGNNIAAANAFNAAADAFRVGNNIAAANAFNAAANAFNAAANAFAADAFNADAFAADAFNANAFNANAFNAAADAFAAINNANTANAFRIVADAFRVGDNINADAFAARAFHAADNAFRNIVNHCNNQIIQHQNKIKQLGTEPNYFVEGGDFYNNDKGLNNKIIEDYDEISQTLQKLAIQLPDTTKLKNAIMQMNYSFETKQIQTINQEYYKLYIASVTQFANEKLPGAKIPEIAPNLDERSLYFLTKLYEKLYKAIKTNDVQTAAQLKHELLWAEQNAAKMKFLVGYYAKHAEPPFLKNTNKTDVSADVLQTLQYLLDNANNEVANFNCDADIKEGKENIKTIFNYLQSVNEVKKNTIESLCLADEYLNDKYNIERIALLIAAKNNGLNVDLIPKPSAAPAAEEQNLFLLFAEGDAPFNDNEIYKKFKTLLQAFATAKDPDKTALKDLLNKLSNFTDIAASGLAVVPAAITNEDAINSTFVLAFQTLGATNAVKYDANNHYNSLEVHNLLKTLAKGEISNDEKTAISSLLANALPPANENQNGRFPARCYLAESGLDINKNLKKCGVVGASHLINIEGLLNKVAAPNERPNLSGIINENILGGADVLGACNNFKNAIAQFANLTSIKDKTLLTTSLAKDLKEIVSVLNLDNDGQINNNPNDKNNPDCNKNAYEKETQIQLLKLLKEINASNLSDEAKLALIKKLATALKIRKAIPQLFLGADGSSIAGMSGIFNAAAGGTTDQSYNLIDIFRQWSPSHFEAAKNAIEKQEKNEDGSLKFDTDNNTAEIERTKIRAILANKSLGADGAIGVPINPDELNNEKNNTAKNFANNLANRLAKVLPAIFTADITANVAAADGAVVSGHCDNVLNQNRINGIAFDFANYKEVSQAKLEYLKLFDKHIDVIKGLPENVEKAILGQALSVFKTPLDNPTFNIRKIKDLEAKMLLAVSEIATTEIEIISGHNLPNPAVNQNKESGNHLNGVFPLINTAITAALFLPLPRCLNDRKALDETKTNEFYKKLTRIALQTKGINDLKQQIQAIWGEIKARTKDGNNLGEKFVNTISNEKRIEIETKLDHIEKEALTKIATNALGDNDIYNAIASSEKETIKTEYNKKTEIIKAFKDDLEMQEQLQTFGAELARIEELDIPKEEMESAKWLAFRNNVNKLEEIACKIYIAKATKVAFNNISPLTKNGIKIATALFEKKNSQLLTKFAKNTLTEIANGKITTIHPWEIEEPSIAATNGQYESILEKIAELQPATQQKLKEFLQLPIFDQLTINENDTELSPKILKAAKEFLKENKTDSSFDFNDLSIANFKEKIKDYGMATLKDKLGTGDAIKTIQNKLKQQPLTNKEKLEIYSSIAYIDQAIVNITDAHVSEEFKNIFKNELAKQNPFSASFDAKNIEKTCEKLLKELSLDERLDKKATKEELEKLKKDNSEEIEKLKEEIEKLKTLDGDKSEEIDKLKQKIEDLEKNTNKKEDIDKLKQKIEDLEKNTNKKEDIDKLKAEIENRFKSFEEKIQSIKEEISNIEKDIKNKEGEEKRLQQEIADLEAKINDPNTSEAEKEAAKRELEQRKERFNTLQEEIDKLKQKKEDLGSNLTELTNLKKEIAELKNNTNNLKNEINNLKKGQNKASPASEDKTEYEVKNVEQQIEIPEKETSNAPEAIGIITGLSMVVVGSLMASSVIAIGTAGLALGITIVAVGAFAMLASVVKVIENSNKDNIKLKINVPSIKQKTQNKDNTKTQAKSTQTAGQGKITNLNTLNASQKTPQIIS